jgi:hypothetical protein
VATGTGAEVGAAGEQALSSNTNTVTNKVMVRIWFFMAILLLKLTGGEFLFSVPLRQGLQPGLLSIQSIALLNFKGLTSR